MGYNREMISSAYKTLEQRRALAESASDDRRRQVYTAIPEIQEIAQSLAIIGAEVALAALFPPPHSEMELAALRTRQQELLNRRKQLLQQAGLPENYMDPVYHCELCRDKGFVGRQRCQCLTRALAEEMFASSNLGAHLDGQSFDTFDLDYYSATDPAGDSTVRKTMEDLLQYARRYADSFASGHPSLLFIGAPGLGKTFLSTSIAKVVIEGGHSVLYETAQNIFLAFEKERFSRDTPRNTPTSVYLDCDLLIVDDLGTEFTSPLSVSTLYNLINTRTIARRPMIISTNLTLPELHKLYSDRIFSRLTGEFIMMHFYGKDIRQLKLRKERA
jgi:DNA replication protein DnaC